LAGIGGSQVGEDVMVSEDREYLAASRRLVMPDKYPGGESLLYSGQIGNCNRDEISRAGNTWTGGRRSCAERHAGTAVGRRGSWKDR
jgi:hypothetical protein